MNPVPILLVFALIVLCVDAIGTIVKLWKLNREVDALAAKLAQQEKAR